MESPPNSSITALSLTRPVTSKARGVCKYYTDPRGCYAKDKCKFLHSEPPKEGESPIPTPYDNSKTCKFYAKGYCRRGDQCWFLHTGRGSLEEEDDLCSICFEKPTTYGLLSGCSHIFCTNCIKQWRDPQRNSVVDSGNTKRCPMCRTPSRFITPSSKFWPDGSAEKQKTIESYQESMSRVQCRYFEKSINKDTLICPFGNECFYQHKKRDGTLHHFKDGAEASMRRYHIRQHNHAHFGQMPIGFANLTFAAALDLNHHWLNMGTFEEANPPLGEEMAVAFETVRNRILGTNGGAGPAQPGQEDADIQAEESWMMMNFLDVVRDRLIPGSRLASNVSASANRPPANSTRNGTASVADEVDDEPLPPLEDVPRASGYDSDNSIPGLRSVSNSSESEDGVDVNRDGLPDGGGGYDGYQAGGDFDGNPVHAIFQAELFRQLFERRGSSDMAEENRTEESRAASSARFSTVVDRSSTSASNSNTPPVAQMGVPISLQWAQALLQMDDPDTDDNDSEGEEIPALELIPNLRNTPSSSPSAQPQPVPSTIVNVSPPPEGPSVRLPPTSATSSPPAGGETARHRAENSVAASTSRKRSAEQDFTTDGRGRVISMGGPELPTAQSQPKVDGGAEGSPELNGNTQIANTPTIQRRASEFTTDGRGRVISIGDPVNAGSSAGVGNLEGTGATASTSESSDSESDDEDEENRGRGGLFSWINAFF